MTPGFHVLPLKVSSFDGRNFILLESFSFVTKSGEVITVPAGADSDGASTPREIWNIVPPFGVYWPAAYLHDWLYRHSTKSKAECDSIFSEAMQLLGTPEVERITIYEGVHFGGAKSFAEDRANQSVAA